jgi:hypothetical protein
MHPISSALKVAGLTLMGLVEGDGRFNLVEVQVLVDRCAFLVHDAHGRVVLRPWRHKTGSLLDGVLGGFPGINPLA